MNKQSRGMNRAGAALLTLAALQISTFDAFAAKEKFVRNKPHVNVGTIGTTSSPTGPGGMTSTPSTPEQPTEEVADCEPDPAKAAETSRPPCEPAD
jgi:hypothetical protein